MVTVALPTLDPAGQSNGFAAYVAARHAFCSVVRREGSCGGSCTSTEWMFASCAACVRSTLIPAPIAFEVLALDATANDGLNASAPQLVTANALDSACVAPNVDVSVVCVANAPQ